MIKGNQGHTVLGKKHTPIIVVLLLVGMLFGVNVPVNAQPSSSLFASDTLLMFVPFKDKSDFSGVWNLGMDVPRFAAAYMKERFRVGVITPVSVRSYAVMQGIDTNRLTRTEELLKLARRFNTRFIITAEVREFSVSRFTVSEVDVAGYESFSAEVKLTFTLFDAAAFGTSRSPVVYEGDVSGEVKNRGLGVTLFGKHSERTSAYFALDEIAFGSEAFNRTIIGDALLRCMEDLGTKLERAVPSLVSRNVVLSTSVVIDSVAADPAIVLTRRLVNGEIVMVDGEDVFLNLGSGDGLAVGDLLPVFGPELPVKDPVTGEVLGTREERIGEVQVIELRAEHLSLGVIVKGKGSVQPKHRVRKVFVR